METKNCTKCKIDLPVEKFAWKVKNVRRSPVCRGCHKTYKDKHYKENRNKLIERAKARKLVRKEWFKDLKGKLICNRCSEDHPATLQFHHENPALKEQAVSTMIARGLGKDRILAEIAKCEVLCANCHSKHHWAETFESGGS